MSRRKVAALYVDPRGPYFGAPGVDFWGEEQDADTYTGPHPVVAHPACGPWGRLAHWYKGKEGDKSAGPLAVHFVRTYGGVLEHPKDSKLWRHMGLPLPGGQLDHFGGYTVAVRQVEWGHPCVKPTWLYLVGGKWAPTLNDPTREPTHKIMGPRKGDSPARRRHMEKTAHLKKSTDKMNRLTPPLFAQELVAFARKSKLGR